MVRIKMALVGAGLCLLAGTGCTNRLYQGDLTAKDAYGKERRFVLYWTKSDPLLGLPSATPATLVTECSQETVQLRDEPEGIVFRGIPGRDRLPGPIATIAPDQICGRVTNFSSLEEPGAGPLSLLIYCEPLPGAGFVPSQRNYPAARREPYVFAVTERSQHRSWRRETLPAPPPPPCEAPQK